MKKIITVISALTISTLMAACSGSIDSDSDKGFIDPGFADGSVDNKAVVTTTYSFGNANIDENCISSGTAGGVHCSAIYYKGLINGTNYECIAVNDNNTEAGPDDNNNFNLKIYKKETDTTWTVKIRKDANVETTTAVFTIADTTTDPVSITLPAISTASYNINAGDTINAKKYSVTE